ncbi:MAG: hypothetical protein K2H42_01245, partial [Alistipes sp.]|nr:hypothetical protein [Alistipes sp.]
MYKFAAIENVRALHAAASRQQADCRDKNRLPARPADIRTMKKILCLLLSCCSLTAFAQRSLEYTAELTGLASTTTTLPMWATVAKNGVYPDSRGCRVYTSAAAYEL